MDFKADEKRGGCMSFDEADLEARIERNISEVKT